MTGRYANCANQQNEWELGGEWDGNNNTKQQFTPETGGSTTQ